MNILFQDIGLHLGAENWLEATVKFAVALLLSGAIGLERQRKGRGAGLRTHVLVCLGATLLMIVSEYVARNGVAGGALLDRARIAAGIITGIGFLGAGTIMKSGQEKVGLTTAAMIWFAAAQGIAVGAGYLLTAFIGTAFALVVVMAFSALEQRLLMPGHFLLSLQLPAAEANTENIVGHIAASGKFEVMTMAIKSVQKSEHLQLTFQIHSKSTNDFGVLEELLHTQYAHAHKVSLERLLV